VSRGTSGEVAGQLGEEKVGVTAGIITRRSTSSSVVLDHFIVHPLPEGSGIWIWEELGVGRGVLEGG